MIESNVGNQVSASMRQAQGQDTRTTQRQQEVNESAVAEQASSQPMAASGAEVKDSVSTQPSDVVSRLGETQEEVPLYESNRPSGSIIRPSIELAQNAERPEAAEEEASTESQAAEAPAASPASEASTPSPAQGPSTDDVQNLV
ncbi:hypothetical protein [Marinospirillum perlucidum]|uniref:hypothetical protein n=1 Tax=Marinospirillum perlucidum TaxID=1982602 RepID=UPI000DF157A3|nr:hypothetical protein [Marinospirillum perlucidum]